MPPRPKQGKTLAKGDLQYRFGNGSELFTVFGSRRCSQETYTLELEGEWITALDAMTSLSIFAFCLAILLGVVQVAVSRGRRELLPFLGFGWFFLFGVVLLFLMAILVAN